MQYNIDYLLETGPCYFSATFLTAEGNRSFTAKVANCYNWQATCVTSNTFFKE